MKRIIFLAFLSLLPLRAGALELSLEENRGESGTIGFVDINRVFKEYSGTSGAREEFAREIKRKEDALNSRKAAVFTIKAEIAKLRQEREFAANLPMFLRETEQPRPAEAPASTDTVSGSTDTAQASAAPAAAQPPADVAALPGMAVDLPGVSRVPLNYFKFSVSTAVADIDRAIEARNAELSRKEDELRAAQRQTELELLEYESRRSELILGRIYVTLRELAVKEGVSVIVDKRSILFGHGAVDLTEKLLKKLEEARE